MKSRSLIDKIIFGGIIVLLVFAPLAFGSVHVWAYSVIEIGVFLLLALWFVDRLIASGSENLSWVKTPVNLVLVMLTYYAHATVMEALKLGAYCGMFFLVVNTLKSRQQIDNIIYIPLSVPI